MPSNYAVLAKARAKFSDRLTGRNYSEMLQCKDVHDVAAYLKTKTSYGKYLSSLNASTVHRGWLEENLQNIFFRELAALTHYDFTLGDKFYEYFVIDGETAYIMTCALLMNNDTSDKYIVAMPQFFNDRTHVDFVALAKAENAKDFLEALSKSPYHKICAEYLSEKSEHIDLLGMAHALDRYKFGKLSEFIAGTKGSLRAELKEYADLLVDVYNIEAIERNNRLRRHSSGIDLNKVIIDGGSLKKKTIEAMLDAKNEKELVNAARNSRYKHYISSVNEGDFSFIEMATAQLVYNKSIHALRFSSNPLVVMLAYVGLLQTEINNIIHIIEGIRYNVDSSRIASMLIGENEK